MIFGLATLGALLLFPHGIEWIPVSALSGFLIFIGLKLVDGRRIRRVLATSAPDTAVMLLTFAVTVFHRVELGIFVGIAGAALLHLHRTRELKLVAYTPAANGRVAEVPFDPESASEPAPLVALGVSGDLFYGVSTALRRQLSDIIEARKPRHLVLRMRRAYSIDYSCWNALFDIAEELHRLGGKLYLCGIRPDFEPIISKAGMQDVLQRTQVFPATDSPFEAFDQCIATILDSDRSVDPDSRNWRLRVQNHGPVSNGDEKA